MTIEEFVMGIIYYTILWISSNGVSDFKCWKMVWKPSLHLDPKNAFIYLSSKFRDGFNATCNVFYFCNLNPWKKKHLKNHNTLQSINLCDNLPKNK